MKRFSGMAVVVALVFMIGFPAMGFAGNSARIIPIGKVSLLQDGQPAQQIGSEMPLPEGVMMLCKGQCMVRANGFQLVAKDNAVFGVTEGAKKWSVTVKSGQLDFALSSDAKLVTFYTPHDVLDITEATMKASQASTLRGTITVTEKNTKLVFHEGTAKVSSDAGTRMVREGAEIQSAQAQLAPVAGEEGLGTGKAFALGTGSLIVGGGIWAALDNGGGGKKETSDSVPTSLR